MNRPSPRSLRLCARMLPIADCGFPTSQGLPPWFGSRLRQAPARQDGGQDGGRVGFFHPGQGASCQSCPKMINDIALAGSLFALLANPCRSGGGNGAGQAKKGEMLNDKWGKKGAGRGVFGGLEPLTR